MHNLNLIQRVPRFNVIGKNSREILLALALLCWLNPLPSLGDTALSAEQLTAITRDSSLKLKASHPTVIGAGPSVTVLAEEPAGLSDRDLKIDAIFLSKTLIDAAPTQIQKVKVLFTQAGANGRYVTVDAREIMDYGSAKISAEKLLSTMILLDVQQEKAPTVVEGPEMDRRLLAWRRIEKLKLQGTGVSPFENLFKEIEAAAKGSDGAKVADKLQFLESKLTSQEEQVRLAHKAASGHGVPASAFGAGAHTTSAGASPVANISASIPLPPLPQNSEALKALYGFKADEVARLVKDKNYKLGLQMIELKKKIDEFFAAKKDGEAFALLAQFTANAKQVLGKDPFAPDLPPMPGGQGGPPGPFGGQGGPPGPFGGQGPPPQ